MNVSKQLLNSNRVFIYLSKEYQLPDWKTIGLFTLQLNMIRVSLMNVENSGELSLNQSSVSDQLPDWTKYLLKQVIFLTPFYTL